MVSPASVANKRLTAWLSPLDATLTKKTGGGYANSSHFGTHPSLLTAFIPVLSFHALTGTPFCNSLLLMVFHVMGGVYHLPKFKRSDVQTSFSPACYTVPPMARQRLGQHFLADLHWREEIARAIRVSPHSIAPLAGDERSLRAPIHPDQHCWIEIGSGHGEMTPHLLANAIPVHPIEIDQAFLACLRHLAKQFPNLNSVPADVLEADIA